MRKIFPKLSFFVYLPFALFQIGCLGYSAFKYISYYEPEYFVEMLSVLIMLLAFLATVIVYGAIVFKNSTNRTLLLICQALLIFTVVLLPAVNYDNATVFYMLFRPIVDTKAYSLLAYIFSEHFLVLPTILNTIHITQKATRAQFCD